MTKKKQPAPKLVPSLLEFARDERAKARRAACPVCALPDDIRAQLAELREGKIQRSVALGWLKLQGYKINPTEFTTHRVGLHDSR